MSERPSSSTPTSPETGPAGAGDVAASQVIGSVLMAGVTVGLAVTFGHALLSAVPDSAGPPPASFELELDEGTQGWADGDEQVLLRHTGGASLATNATTIRVTLGQAEHVFEPSALDGAFADGRFAIGERWNASLSIGASTEVSLVIVRDASPRETVASLHARSTSGDCGADTDAPTVLAWSQDPEDLDAGTEGPVEVTATVQDDCSGVDTDTTPHLRHRFDDTTTFSDAGSMEHLSGTTWQGSIPEPSDGWSAHAGETLVYRLDPLEDLAGNTGVSENVTETVDADDAVGGELTYVTDPVLFSGTITDFANAQNASDGGLAAVLEENVTSPNATTSEAYGTAFSSSAGTEDAGDATGSPDDDHALTSSDDEWVGVEGFQTFSGGIESVELALQGHYTGTIDGAEDELELSYRVGTEPGKTKTGYDTSMLNESADGPTEYLDVTGDRDWSWSDVDELQVRATYDRKGPLDSLEYAIDALWVRVTYDNPSYNMSLGADVASLPSGSHDLELRYRVSEETHHVQVWNATGQAWEERGRSLTAASFTNWTTPLTSDDVDNSTVRFRVVDDVRDPDQQSTVELDHARVRTR